jgi:glycosyltransferase involved in cell wall biosynthesis
MDTYMALRLVKQPVHLSIIIPFYNEEINIPILLQNLSKAMQDYHAEWEVIAVDDGSTDNSYKSLLGLQSYFGKALIILPLQRNFGQTAAMQAGIDQASGEIIVTLDGDLQNDPADIPRLVKKLEDDNLDLLVGWRKNRRDNFWLRKLPSVLANWLIGRFTGVRLHDYGCSLKVYRATVIKGIRLYGDMHRFIPAWAAINTSPSRIAEEIVSHHSRINGRSKYGLSRSFRVVIDLISVYFFLRYRSRPGHFFGKIGLTFGVIGSAILSYLAVLKFYFHQDIGTRPMLLTGVFLVISAIQFITTGVISEFLSRIYYESSGYKSYQIRPSNHSGNHRFGLE